jgi:hypothetical protein
VSELDFGRRRATVAVADGEPGKEVQVDVGHMQALNYHFPGSARGSTLKDVTIGVGTRAAIALLASAAGCELGGCGLLLDLDGRGDGGSADATPSPPDASPADVAPELDAGSACVEPPPAGVFAHFRFDGDFSDARGAALDGMGVSPFTFVEGATGCGSAVSFGSRPAADTGFVVLAPSDLWRRAEGSIELMVRVDELTSAGAGVLSRDTIGAGGGGHLTLMVASTRQLGVRIQGTVANASALCSDHAIPLRTWVHVGIQFGATARLFVDGVQQSFDGTITGGAELVRLDCRGAELLDRPLDGNDEPWVIGAATWDSDPGSATPTSAPLVGAVDELRFWSDVVDFTAR